MSEPTKNEIEHYKQCYQTPPDFLWWAGVKVLPTHGHTRFTLDTCAEPWNTKCPEFIAPDGTMPVSGMIGTNGITTSWKTGGAAWCNPGFRNIWPWTRQARAQRDAGQLSVVLSHATHAADWAQWTIRNAAACYLINPRINFDEDPRYLSELARNGKKPGGNPRDSMLWVFDPSYDGPCQFINAEPWIMKVRRRKKKAA